MKQNIGIIFGGKSVEHEVSIVTGLQVVENIDRDKYNPIPIYIDKDGFWFHGDKLTDVKIYSNWDKNKKKVKQFFPSFDKKDKKNILNKLYALIIAMHGNYGEDGKLQGMIDFMDIPYSSSGVVGSATGMDKIVMKNVFVGLGLPVLPYLWFNKFEWEKDKNELIKKIHYTLDYPIFVKPANLGSSIGISMANNENELINAIEIAIRYDKRILVEKGVENVVEVNSSALLNNNEVQVSAMEEPVRWEKFLSFNDKYIRSNSKSKSGMSGMSRKIPAQISDEIKKQIESHTKIIYKAMDCKGVVRIDYILNSDKDKVYVNEINTIPGSMSFYLWEPVGIKFKDLIDILIDQAVKSNNDKEDQIVRYDSDILKRLGGSKGSKR
jgi:D-alanine-D-alanine ligase